MRVTYENMSVAEFTCRHEEFGDPTDVNGIDLPIEADIRVEYWGEGEEPEPQAYCVIDLLEIASWNQGGIPPFRWLALYATTAPRNFFRRGLT
jgi:hypothetical protein